MLRSAWVETDAASKTANMTSVETRLLAASVFTSALRGAFCTPVPPRCLLLPVVENRSKNIPAPEQRVIPFDCN